MGLNLVVSPAYLPPACVLISLIKWQSRYQILYHYALIF